jgi:peroxiredoxin
MALGFIRRWLGESSMTKVVAGNRAPIFALPGVNGQQYSLAEALAQGPVLLVFFKVTCPTCQFTFPFLERLYESYGGSNVSFWGISQDDVTDTKEFCQEFGITFPVLIDADGYPASNQYGLTNVPTILLIGTDCNVLVACVGFSKEDLEKISDEIAGTASKSARPLFQPEEIIPSYKPG